MNVRSGFFPLLFQLVGFEVSDQILYGFVDIRVRVARKYLFEILKHAYPDLKHLRFFDCHKFKE